MKGVLKSMFGPKKEELTRRMEKVIQRGVTKLRDRVVSTNVS